MEKNLYVTSKDNFGREDFYPDCETSKFFCSIHGTKIIPPALMRVLKSKEFTFTVRARQL